MRSRIVMLVATILLLTNLTSCAKSIELNPILDTDLVFLEEGQDFKAPQKGAFMSDMYMKEIANIKANNV